MLLEKGTSIDEHQTTSCAPFDNFPVYYMTYMTMTICVCMYIGMILTIIIDGVGLVAFGQYAVVATV